MRPAFEARRLRVPEYRQLVDEYNDAPRPPPYKMMAGGAAPLANEPRGPRLEPLERSEEELNFVEQNGAFSERALAAPEPSRRHAELLVHVQRLELSLAVQNHAMSEVREELRVLQLTQSAEARLAEPATRAVPSVAARQMSDEQRISEQTSESRALAMRVGQLEAQAFSFAESGERRLLALEQRLAGVSDVGRLVAAQARANEESARASVEIQQQSAQLDAVRFELGEVQRAAQQGRGAHRQQRDQLERAAVKSSASPRGYMRLRILCVWCETGVWAERVFWRVFWRATGHSLSRVRWKSRIVTESDT